MSPRALHHVLQAVVLVGFAPVALAAPPVPTASPVGAAGTVRAYVFRPGPTSALVVRLDASWSESSRYHDGELREIRFLREKPVAARARAKLLVTPMATLPDEKMLNDATGGRDVVEQQLASMASQAVEKNPPITDAKEGAVRFVSFTVTDPHPKPGELPLATQGVLTIGGLASSVTILHEDLGTRDEIVKGFARWAAFGTPNVVNEPTGPVSQQLAAACKRGDGLACGLQHELAADDPAAKRSPSKELALLTAGCKAGSALACGSLGSLYAEGEGVKKDEARARKIFAQGCDAHGWLACQNAASLANRGRPEGAPLTAESVAFIERACAHGGDHGGVCRASPDAEAPPAKYVEAKKAACGQGDGVACRHLGWAYETGYSDLPVDVDRARDAYHQACAAKSLWGCFREALFTADAKQQARLYDAACQQGSGPACYALAQPLYGQTPEARHVLARKACDASIEMACVEYMSGLGK